jgi:DNA-binding transcriptional LysR family regulator
VGLVAESRVDFAVTPLARQTTPAMRFEPLLRTPLVAVCGTDHPLAGARDVDPGRFQDEEVIDLPRGWWVRELFDGLLAERGLRRRVHIEVNEWFGVLAMVRQGLGVTYGPLACLDQEVVPGLAWATLAGAPSWDLGIVTRDDTLLGAAGRAFLAVYRDRCRAALAAGPAGPPPVAHGRRRAVD